MRDDGVMTSRLIDALYTEAMILADEARGYFDDRGAHERAGLPPITRVSFTCESLKVTTRLMHIIAWLLTRRAVDAGEIGLREARHPSRRLGDVDAGGPPLDDLPETARILIAASRDLYERVRRLDQDMERDAPPGSPAHTLLQRIENAF